MTDTAPDTLEVEGVVTPDLGRKPTSPGRLVISALPFAVILVVLLWILLPGVFTSYDPLNGSDDRFLSPNAAHWFGTDQLGRDVYTRFVYGGRITFLTAGIAILVGGLLGTALGVVTSTLRPAVEVIGMRFIDALISVPSFLIAILIATAFGRGWLQVGIGVGIGAIALFARVSRAEIVKVVQYDFVQASYLSGSGYFKVVFIRILPNSIGSILALAVVEFAAIIIAISALGYLGFGAPPPTPEWGVIIAEGRDYVSTAWWIVILPSIALAVVVLALGVIGRRFARRFRI